MKYPLETLTARLDDWDFAVLVWAPDDQTESRTRKAPAPRDNVVLEAGLSIGRLGRDRTFVLVPRTRVELKIPSDVKQISLMEYSDQNMRMVARRIRKEIERLGPRTRLRYGSQPTTGA
jgi:predicted nucleotide-binding protein